MRFIIPILALVALGAGLALWFWPELAGPPAPAQPAPLGDLSRVDPLVAELVRSKHADVLARPEAPEPWLELGLSLAANEFPDQAAAAIEQYLRMRPDDPKGWFHLSLIQSSQGRDDEAMTSMRRAAALDNAYAPLQWRLGRMLLDRGELDQAQRAFTRATEVDQLDSAGWLGLALVDMDRGQDAQAAAKLEQLLAWTTTNVEYARHLLATTYHRLGRAEQAARLVDAGEDSRAVWSDPWAVELMDYRPGPGAKLRIARELMATDRIPEAVTLLESMRRQWPDRHSVLTTLGDAYRSAGRLDESVEVLKEAVAQNPNLPGTHFGLATTYAKKTLAAAAADTATWRDAALVAIGRALELDPRHTLSYALRGDLLALSRQWPESAAAYLDAARYDPTNPEWPYRAGVIQAQSGSWTEALDSFSMAITRAPARIDAARGQALALLQLRRLDQAEALLDKWRAAAPTDAGFEALRQQLQALRRPAPPDSPDSPESPDAPAPAAPAPAAPQPAGP